MEKEIQQPLTVEEFFNKYDVIKITAFARLLGIDGSLLRQYSCSSAYISDNRIKEIQVGINKLGNELSGVVLTKIKH